MATAILDPPYVGVQPEPESLEVSEEGPTGDYPRPRPSTSPTRVKPREIGAYERADRKFPKGRMSCKELLRLLENLLKVVDRYTGRDRESDHARCIRDGCITILRQLAFGMDPKGWMDRRTRGVRRRRYRVLQQIHARPHGKDEKKVLADLILYTRSAVTCSAGIIHPNPITTGALPLSWNL